MFVFVFFFNDTATTEIYTLSLHDALPIFVTVREQMRDDARVDTGTRSRSVRLLEQLACGGGYRAVSLSGWADQRVDRKSTRLNSSHANISYAVFCLKKKKKQNCHTYRYIR